MNKLSEFVMIFYARIILVVAAFHAGLKSFLYILWKGDAGLVSNQAIYSELIVVSIGVIFGLVAIWTTFFVSGDPVRRLRIGVIPLWFIAAGHLLAALLIWRLDTNVSNLLGSMSVSSFLLPLIVVTLMSFFMKTEDEKQPVFA